MTEAEQFATEFLGVQPESFPIHINLKITGELLDAYLAHIEKKKETPTPKPFKYENGYGLSTNSATQELHRRQTEKVNIANGTKEEIEPISLELSGGMKAMVQNHKDFDEIMKSSMLTKEQLDGLPEIKKNPVRTLVWDWKNNCYEPENKNK